MAIGNESTMIALPSPTRSCPPIDSVCPSPNTQHTSNEEELEYTNLDILAGMVPEQKNLPDLIGRDEKLADAILGGEHELDWDSLFPASDLQFEEETGEEQLHRLYKMPPRMAAAIFRECIILVDVVRICGPKGGGYSGEPLPRILRKYFQGKHTKKLRILFLACFDRIILRLSKGVIPRPNCIGEVVALALIIESVEANIGFDRHEFHHLASTSHDENFDLLRSSLFDLDDKIALSIILSQDAGNDNDSTSLTSSDLSMSTRTWTSSDLSMSTRTDMSLSVISLFNMPGEGDEAEDPVNEEHYLRYISQLQNCHSSSDIQTCLKQEQEWIENNIRTYWQMTPDDEDDIKSSLKPARAEMIHLAETQLTDFISKKYPNAPVVIKIEEPNKLLNLHPGRWSVAFSAESFQNHL